MGHISDQNQTKEIQLHLYENCLETIFYGNFMLFHDN